MEKKTKAQQAEDLAGEGVEESAINVANNMKIEEKEDASALAVSKVKDTTSDVKTMQQFKAGLKTKDDKFFDLPVEEIAKRVVERAKESEANLSMEDAIRLVNEEKIARQAKQV